MGREIVLRVFRWAIERGQKVEDPVELVRPISIAKPGRHALVIDSITKKDAIINRAGQSAVRDDGDRLQVSTGADRAGVLESLKLAVERYGDRITVNGATEFKAQAIRAAVYGKLAQEA